MREFQGDQRQVSIQIVDGLNCLGIVIELPPQKAFPHISVTYGGACRSLQVNPD